jgi:hypothetical protein
VIVEFAVECGLMMGAVLYTDAMYLKASAKKNKFYVVRVEIKRVEHLTLDSFPYTKQTSPKKVGFVSNLRYA